MNLLGVVLSEEEQNKLTINSNEQPSLSAIMLLRLCGTLEHRFTEKLLQLKGRQKMEDGRWKVEGIKTDKDYFCCCCIDGIVQIYKKTVWY